MRKTSLVLLVGYPLLSACSGGDLLLPSDGAPAALTVVSGDGQLATAGAPVPEPLVVRVEDAGGRPVQGASVRFEFAAGTLGATVSPAAAATDSTGLAATTVTLGQQAGEQRVLALLTEAAGLGATFRLIALAPPPPPSGGDGGGGGGGDDDDDDDGSGKGKGRGKGGGDD